MKKISRVGLTACSVLTLVLGITLNAVAHDEGGPAGDKGRPAGMWKKGGGHGMDNLKKRLGLSDDQASKLRDLFKKQGEEMKPLRERMKIDMDTLRLKVDSKASDSEIKKSLDSLSADRRKMETGRQEMKEKMDSVLTPTQRAKMLLKSERPGGERMKGRMGQKMGKGNNHGGDPQKGKTSPGEDM